MLDAGESVAGAAFAVAYPAADLILLALVVAVIVLHGGRAGAPWAALAGGLACTTVADVIFALETMSSTAASANRALTMLYALWVLGLVAAPMLASARRVEGTLEGWRSLAAPMSFSVMVVALRTSSLRTRTARRSATSSPACPTVASRTPSSTSAAPTAVRSPY
jgi:hypothetical protein